MKTFSKSYGTIFTKPCLGNPRNSRPCSTCVQQTAMLVPNKSCACSSRWKGCCRMCIHIRKTTSVWLVWLVWLVWPVWSHIGQDCQDLSEIQICQKFIRNPNLSEIHQNFKTRSEFPNNFIFIYFLRNFKIPQQPVFQSFSDV